MVQWGKQSKRGGNVALYPACQCMAHHGEAGPGNVTCVTKLNACAVSYLLTWRETCCVTSPVSQLPASRRGGNVEGVIAWRTRGRTFSPGRRRRRKSMQWTAQASVVCGRGSAKGKRDRCASTVLQLQVRGLCRRLTIHKGIIGR